MDLWQKRVAQLESQVADQGVKAEDYGFEAMTLPNGVERSALEELIRWRLWNRTGGGVSADVS